MQCYIPVINSVCLKIAVVLTAEQRLANNQTQPAIPSEHLLMQCYILIINSVCLKILTFISKFQRQIYEIFHQLHSCFMTYARVKFQNPDTHKEGE